MCSRLQEEPCGPRKTHSDAVNRFVRHAWLHVLPGPPGADQLKAQGPPTRFIANLACFGFGSQHFSLSYFHLGIELNKSSALVGVDYLATVTPELREATRYMRNLKETSPGPGGVDGCATEPRHT